MTGGILVGLSVVGAAWILAGVLLRGRRGSLVAAPAVAAGTTLLAGVAVYRYDDRVGMALTGVSLFILMPAALVSYSGAAAWRRGDGWVLAAVVGLGALLVGSAAGPEVDGVGAAVVAALLAIVVLLHFWWRLEQAGADERRPLLWLLVGLGAMVVGFFVLAFVVARDGVVAEAVAAVTLAAVPAAVAVGARDPRSVEARSLLVSAVVTLTALVTVVASYVAVVSWAEVVTGSPVGVGWQAVVAAAAGALLAPARSALREVVDRLLFGERPDPLSAVTRVVHDVGDDPASALDVVREALALPYLALTTPGPDGQERRVAESGQRVDRLRRLSVSGRDGTPLAELSVGVRPGDLRLGESDLVVLRAALPLLAQTLRARAAAEELRAARSATLTATAEERRRLRRELHDGLGPRLSGAGFAVDAAANLVSTDDEAAALLARVREELAQAVADLRVVVYGLRPPALDQLGLVAAIRQHGEILGAGERHLEVTVSAPDELGVLPAAAEVAAYRIAVEALTNAARHSGSPTATVQVCRTGDELRLAVLDEGTGGAWTAGVGLTSMAERAREIGGRLVAGPTAAGGRVEAVLPLTGRRDWSPA